MHYFSVFIVRFLAREIFYVCLDRFSGRWIVSLFRESYAKEIYPFTYYLVWKKRFGFISVGGVIEIENIPNISRCLYILASYASCETLPKPYLTPIDRQHQGGPLATVFGA